METDRLNRQHLGKTASTSKPQLERLVVGPSWGQLKVLRPLSDKDHPGGATRAAVMRADTHTHLHSARKSTEMHTVPHTQIHKAQEARNHKG